MRTRIALVAVFSIALITVSLLSQVVSVPSARAAARPSHPTARGVTPHHRDLLTSLVHRSTVAAPAGSAFALGMDRLVGRPGGAPAAPVAAPVPPPAPAVLDTVTPAQRAAWQRVADCEEGGNWASDGSRFSGGLGITRANWAIFGGLQYAPEGAMATPDEQIMVAERIQGSAPDQCGCRGW